MRYIILGALNSLILLAISGSAGFDIVQRCGSLTPCSGPGWGTWLMAGLPLLLLLVGAVIFAPRAIRSIRARRAETKAAAITLADNQAAAGDADDAGLSRLARLRAAPTADIDMDVDMDAPAAEAVADDFDMGIDDASDTWPAGDRDAWETDADDFATAEEEWTRAEEATADAEVAPTLETPLDTPLDMSLDTPDAADWAADGADADNADSDDGADSAYAAEEIAPGFTSLDDWQVEAPATDDVADAWSKLGSNLEDATATDAVPDAPYIPTTAYAPADVAGEPDAFAAGRDRIIWAMDGESAADAPVAGATTDATVTDATAAPDMDPDAHDVAATSDQQVVDDVDWSMPSAISDAGEDDAADDYAAADHAEYPPIGGFAVAEPWSEPLSAAPATQLSPLQQAAWLIAPGPLPRLRAHGETGFPWAAATISAVADSMLDLASPSSLGEFAAEVSAWKQVVAELPAATPIAAADAEAFNAWLESLAQHLFLFGTSPDLETLIVDALSRLTLAAEGDAALAALLPASLFPTEQRDVA
ncbi:MAG: hypothetical protein IT553_01100 [Sphingomonadaceae bacterium]|nr:hypothetical protein [Sphingomonadaceae bacterium]